MRITYYDATPGDAPALAALFAESFTATFGHLYAPEDLAAFLAASNLARWQGELADPPFAFRIAMIDDAPIGFAKLGPPALPIERRGPAIELRQLYLLDAAKGRGVGQALMEWTVATARARGAAELWLSVYHDNIRARRLYERYGFEDVGRYTFMVGQHADEDRLMRLVL